jgi:hypothetical protein
MLKSYRTKPKPRKYTGILHPPFIVDFRIKTNIELVLVITKINSLHY